MALICADPGSIALAESAPIGMIADDGCKVLVDLFTAKHLVYFLKLRVMFTSMAFFMYAQLFEKSQLVHYPQQRKILE